MMRHFAAPAGFLMLAACAAAPPEDAASCAVVLVASGQSTTAGLMQAAALSPACNRLAQDAVQAALREAILRLGK